MAMKLGCPAILFLTACYFHVGTAITVQQQEKTGQPPPQAPEKPVPPGAPAPAPAAAGKQAPKKKPVPKPKPMAKTPPPVAPPVAPPNGGAPPEAPPPPPPGVGGAGFFLSTGVMILILVVVACLPVASVVIVAHYYLEHKHAKSPYKQVADLKEYKTGLFGCFDDLPLCCFSLNCPIISWADTMSSVKEDPGGSSPTPPTATSLQSATSLGDSSSVKPILKFWTGLFILLAVQIVSFIFSGLGAQLVGWIAFACLVAHYRTKFRTSFGFEHTGHDCMKDCVLAAFCGICVIAQDARHLAMAKKLNHKATIV
jgi:Cys-rich protein (TIGR01571 family)